MFDLFSILKRYRQPPSPHRGTIMVVMEDALLRLASVRHLRRLGYDVLEARHGAEGLCLADEWGGRIHLLLTELDLPYMDGVDLARRIRRWRPDLRVMFVAGTSADGAGDATSEIEGALSIERPFSLQSLQDQVRDVLDGLHAPGVAADAPMSGLR